MPVTLADHMTPLLPTTNGQMFARYLRKVKEKIMMNKENYFWRRKQL